MKTGGTVNFSDKGAQCQPVHVIRNKTKTSVMNNADVFIDCRDAGLRRIPTLEATS